MKSAKLLLAIAMVGVIPVIFGSRPSQAPPPDCPDGKCPLMQPEQPPQKQKPATLSCDRESQKPEAPATD